MKETVPSVNTLNFMALGLDSLTNLVGSTLLRGKSSSVLGIDLGNSSIKVVQLRKEKETAILETYGELALGPYAQLDIGRATNLSPDRLGEALKDVIKEANVTTTVCGAAIPFSSSLVTLLEMPPLGAAKLATMIPIEARKYIPVPISEVQLDWFIVPEAETKYFYGSGAAGHVDESAVESQKTLVLLVAIHSDTISRYTEALKFAGLTPSFYEIETFSVMRAVVDRGVTSTAVIDIGAATTKVYIMQLGIILASHVIGKGSQDITLALANTSRISIAKAEELKRDVGLEGAMASTPLGGISSMREPAAVAHVAALTLEYIFVEARRALLNFQKKYNQSINKVILTGGGATIKGIGSLATKHLEIQTELADPFSRVQTPAFLEDVLREAGPEFTVAVGASLRKLQEM